MRIQSTPKLPPTSSAEEEDEPPYVSPIAARRAQRFEPKELPMHILVTLVTHGDQPREDLRQAAFGPSPDKHQRRRVNATLDALLRAKKIRRIGKRRHYLFRVTALGRKLVESPESPTKG